MSKRILLIAALLATFLSGAWLAYRFLAPGQTAPEQSATVLLEKIRTVIKLTTVEGEFSEIYNYKQSSGYMLLPDKKALVRVQAVVSAGYDLSNLQIQTDSMRRVLRIGPLPAPQILSIDHTLDYYDISTGIFMDFSPEDYNFINKNAKAIIREQALKSNLLPAAREQADKVFDIIRFMAESTGWKVEIVQGEGPSTPN
ncbi:MAG: DUF4230 domain-containing protein [Saprospirales bacterium]|jgi:hypothetical protein|nr:DUF4230 domain-containing protein [Saprospirales bacterium]MBK8920620.1 DUF4230 domain-containing protein [Saprospirales bacterium]